ncbi:MAG TPA: phytanoyl-CoA dioxygenase family protein [Chloroflexota bacterium]|nr:phytanoyl-CoA dioxygenase family protein [Chloroflexota bacterium]
MAPDIRSLTPAELAAFQQDGYAIAHRLFTQHELDGLMQALQALYAQRQVPGCFEAIPVDEATDPLDAYPRMMHPHRVSETAMHWMLNPRLEPILRALLGETPLAAQSMFYWKPPGGRGQALHQDNYYLRVRPATCLAAWLAIDSVDRENGGLFVVPGSHKLDVFCPEQADLSVSFAGEFVPPPKGLAEMPVDLDPGDVLFFGGSLIHGSQPNHSADRFRRSFICHYVGVSAQEISWYYQPLYRFDGAEAAIAEASGGGPCGDLEPEGPH